MHLTTHLKIAVDCGRNSINAEDPESIHHRKTDDIPITVEPVTPVSIDSSRS